MPHGHENGEPDEQQGVLIEHCPCSRKRFRRVPELFLSVQAVPAVTACCWLKYVPRVFDSSDVTILLPGVVASGLLNVLIRVRFMMNVFFALFLFSSIQR